MNDAPRVAGPRRAMILAAGYGTRLRPLTDHLPKPLVPVLGRPLLDTIMLNLLAAGVERLAVNAHHLAAKLAAHVAAGAPGADIELFHEPDILGTGGALAGARDFLDQDDFFLLHNGDVLTDLDLGSLVGEHLRTGAVATLALVDWAPANTVLLLPSARGTVGGEVIDVDGRLETTPTPGARRLTYSGVAVISRELLGLLPAGPSSLVDALLKALSSRRGAVRGWAPTGAYWNDLGTIGRYLEAHRHLLAERRLALPCLPTPPGPVMRGEGARIAGDAVLDGFVCLGRDCDIGAGARLEDCVVLDGVSVPAGRALRRAVAGDGWTATEAAERAAELPCVRAAGFGSPVACEEITGHGSDRLFVRLDDGGRSAVLMRSPPDDEEFDRYVAIGRFLHAEGLGGPEILAVDAARRAVLVEDLGDRSLRRLVSEARAGGGARPAGDEWPAAAPPPPPAALYRQALDLLVELQVRGTAALARCPAAGERRFDHQTLRWETDYFRRRFLHEACGLPAVRLAPLTGEFERLAQAVLAQPVVLMHRDFQSENIMFKSGAPRLVDFQGMRRGPLAYDVMSLLRDPYVDLPEAMIAELLAYYRDRLVARGGPAASAPEMPGLAAAAGLQRSMQALGAYAFLSRIKGKTGFAAHVPAGLRQLRCGLRALRASGPAPGPLPWLEEIAAELSETAGGG